MKISLAWIFDHIDADWKKQDVKEIVEKFNAVTAEIEGVEKLNFDSKKLFLGEWIGSSKNGVELDVPELGEKITLEKKKIERNI